MTSRERLDVVDCLDVLAEMVEFNRSGDTMWVVVSEVLYRAKRTLLAAIYGNTVSFDMDYVPCVLGDPEQLKPDEMAQRLMVQIGELSKKLRDDGEHGMNRLYAEDMVLEDLEEIESWLAMKYPRLRNMS